MCRRVTTGPCITVSASLASLRLHSILCSEFLLQPDRLLFSTTMINPPDELLEDLQTNFPPAAQPLSDGAANGHTSPGHDHLESHYYDKFEGDEHSRGYISPPAGQKQQDSRAGMPQVSHHSVLAYLLQVLDVNTVNCESDL